MICAQTPVNLHLITQKPEAAGRGLSPLPLPCQSALSAKKVSDHRPLLSPTSDLSAFLSALIRADQTQTALTLQIQSGFYKSHCTEHGWRVGDIMMLVNVYWGQKQGTDLEMFNSYSRADKSMQKHRLLLCTHSSAGSKHRAFIRTSSERSHQRSVMDGCRFAPPLADSCGFRPL